MERGEADDERSARLPEHGRHILPLPLGLGTRQGEKLMQGVHKELCVLFCFYLLHPFHVQGVH